MNTRQFIDQLSSGEASSAKNTLDDVLSARAFEALDNYKKEISANIFGGEKQEITQNEE
jgi:hypothetical protein